MRLLFLLLVLGVGVGIGAGTGCSDGGHDGHDHAPGDHSHDGDDGHDHAPGDGDDGHGERQLLGTVQAGSAKGTVFQYGTLVLGGEAQIEVELADAGAANAVRVWFGDETARGVTKALAEKLDSGAYHAHVEVKAELPDSAKVWVEIETKDGDRGRASVAAKR